jgi:hypothetical protein
MLGGTVFVPLPPDCFISSRGISDSSDRIAETNGKGRREGSGRKGDCNGG